MKRCLIRCRCLCLCVLLVATICLPSCVGIGVIKQRGERVWYNPFF